MSAPAAEPITPYRLNQALSVFFLEMPRKCLSVEFTVLGILLHEVITRENEPVVINIAKISKHAGLTEPSAIDAMRRLETKGLISTRTHQGTAICFVLETMLAAAAEGSKR
jgi:DNA-binding MarR family transcriptional regulator